MDFIITITSILLFCSLFLNFYLCLELRDAKKNVNKNHSIDAQQLLHDMTRGGALVKITRVDPESVFLRAPGT